MSEWQPIETAPRDGTEILVGAREGTDGQFWTQTVVKWELGPSRWWNQPDVNWWRLTVDGAQSINDAAFFEPTHWAQLPPPPERIG